MVKCAKNLKNHYALYARLIFKIWMVNDLESLLS